MCSEYDFYIIFTKGFLILHPENLHGTRNLVHDYNRQTPRDVQREAAFSGITQQAVRYNRDRHIPLLALAEAHFKLSMS